MQTLKTVMVIVNNSAVDFFDEITIHKIENNEIAQRNLKTLARIKNQIDKTNRAIDRIEVL